MNIMAVILKNGMELIGKVSFLADSQEDAEKGENIVIKIEDARKILVVGTPQGMGTAFAPVSFANSKMPILLNMEDILCPPFDADQSTQQKYLKETTGLEIAQTTPQQPGNLGLQIARG